MCLLILFKIFFSSVKNNFWPKTTGCPCTNRIFYARSNNSVFIPVTWLIADVCHATGTKHGLDLFVVGSYITFASCNLFITLTVIIYVMY